MSPNRIVPSRAKILLLQQVERLVPKTLAPEHLDFFNALRWKPRTNRPRA
jgi:hypothetical protein